jgi:hypothetical protein
MAWSIVLRDGSTPIFNNTSKNNQKMADKLRAIARSNHFGAESAFIFYAAK